MWRTISRWAYQRRQDIAVVGVLLAIAGVVTATNFAGYPMGYEDEGTYVSQARAVQFDGELAHYTYWYDHPPVAWLQIAAYTALTGAYERYESTIAAGREFMVVLHLISVVLLYAIARRLHVGKGVAALAVLLFVLSPLALEYSRYVFIDNVAVPWMLGAFLLALSPRKHIATAIGAAICMAIAVLSKETFLLFLPALLYAMYQNSDARNRRYVFSTFGVVFCMIGAFYVLFAALKGELFPGPGHVSLFGTILWQLFGREGSGSILEVGTDANNLFQSWLRTDPWLMIASAVALPLTVIYRPLRPFAVALAIGGLMMLRPGYLPVPYIIALLPFMALAVAGAAYVLFVRPMQGARLGTWRAVQRHAAELGSVAVVLGVVYFVVPAWHTDLATAMQVDADRSRREAVAWIANNVPRGERMVVESVLWSDLQKSGFNQPEPVWVYKTETDPEVTEAIGGWRGIDYLILDEESRREEIRDDFPLVFTAKDHAEVIATFGEPGQTIVVMKVEHPPIKITSRAK